MALALVRVFVVLAVLGGVVALGVRLGGGDDRDDDDGARAAAPAAPTAPAASSVNLTEEAGWTIVHYVLAAPDALVLHLSDDEMDSCNFAVIPGPRDGAKRLEPGIVLDSRIVPLAQWEQTVRRLGQACNEYWYSVE